MKNRIYMRWLLLILVSFTSLVNAQEEIDYKIRFKVKGLEKDSVAYLAFYRKESTYIKDTLQNTKGGEFVFTGKYNNKDLLQGMYMLVTQRNQMVLNFILTEPEFSLTTDTLDPVKSMVVKGSVENQLYFDYNKALAPLSKKASELQEQLMAAKGKDQAKFDQLRDELKKLHEQKLAMDQSYMDKAPNSFNTTILKAQAQMERIPEHIQSNEGKLAWFQQHYFDNLDMTDPRLLITPPAMFHDKIQEYLDKYVGMEPDTIYKHCVRILEMCRPNSLMFEVMGRDLLSKYEQSKFACHDKVFAYLAKKYLMDEKLSWYKEDTNEKIVKRVKEIWPTLCGHIAYDISTYDTTGTTYQLSKINSEYTVMVFWDSDCGHCKKALPKVTDFYNEYKDKGVFIYGINTEWEGKEYKEFLKEKKLPWVSTQDTAHLSQFRAKYNIETTPAIFVLDKDKKILFKKVDAGKLGDIIEMLRKQAEKREEEN